jgi:hypothetical protein
LAERDEKSVRMLNRQVFLTGHVDRFDRSLELTEAFF